MAFTNIYQWSVTQPPSIHTSAIVIVPYWQWEFVLGNPLFPPRPKILINANQPPIPFDYDRSNLISQNTFDFERTMMHETLHALGLEGYFASDCLQLNGLGLVDLFRVTTGDSAIFPFAVRRSGQSLNTVMVPLVNTEYRVNDEDGQWHWNVNVVPVIGTMVDGVVEGECLPYTLYQSDLRALDIIGYNFDPGTIETPPSLEGVFPVQAAASQPLSPTFAWAPPPANTGCIVTVFSNAAMDDAHRVYQSMVAVGDTHTLVGTLQPSTQYWWRVTTINRFGALSNGSTRSFTTGEGITCDPIDFNQDSLFPDTQDIDDFLAVFSGGVCPSTGTVCNSDIDFNNDTLFPDTLDIAALLSVYSGGPCL